MMGKAPTTKSEETKSRVFLSFTDTSRVDKREFSPTARIIWKSPETVVVVTTGEGVPLASSGLMPGMLTS